MPSIFFLSLMNGAAWGGSEELWYRTALSACNKGHKIGCALYYWKEKDEKIKALREAGCDVYLLPNKGRSKKNLTEKFSYKISKWRVRQMIASLPFQEYSLTVINLGGFEIYTSAWKDTYRRISNYALLFHNYDEHAFFKPQKASRLRQWLGHAKLNLFASRRIKETLQKKLSIEIHNADIFINPITIQSSLTSLPSTEPSIFVMLAELDVTRKAQDNLIKALAEPQWQNRNWRLFLYGKGNDMAMLEKLIARLGLEDKVYLKGYVRDVKNALGNAHLVLQITHSDAMPLAVIEAMAVGRPVIISKIGDMPYWVQEGRNGWMSNDASVKEIDAAMERAWQQKEQWPQAGKASFLFFKENFPLSPEERFLEQLQKGF